MSYLFMILVGIGIAWAWVHFSIAKSLRQRIEALENEFLWNRTSGKSSAPPDQKQP